ncbi:hypothetical protein Hanom_Chr05g00391611 [Helianthus anomalus]
MAILVKSGKRFSADFILTWKDHNIHVWVEEIFGQWCPSFLEEDCPIPGSPKLPSEVGGAPDEVGSDMSDHDDNDSDTCMGKSSVFNSPSFENYVERNSLHGEVERPLSVSHEERESGRHFLSHYSEVEEMGSPTDIRPSLNTLRPKKKKYKNSKAHDVQVHLKNCNPVQEAFIPDLNVEAEKIREL